MNKPFSWKNTSLKINSDTDEGANLIEAFNEEKISLRDNESGKTLENQQHYFILEDEFINECKNLSLIIRKYSFKDYAKLGKLYDKNHKEFINIYANSIDKSVYEEIIKDNNIDANIREVPVSINVLRKVFDSNNSKSTLVLDILILLALANKSSFSAEVIDVEFRIEDKSFKDSLNLSSKPLNLFPLYNWVINNEEYKESHNVKLQVVRQVIINKQNIRDVDGILEDSKLAYKRIISKKTNEYFEQLNQLKDDFLVLSKNENSSLRTLHLTFFAWLGSLGLELLNIIIDYNGSDIIQYLLCSKGAKKGIVIMAFIIALIAIFAFYVLEIKSLEKTYEVIKKIYKDKILFETDLENENKFENTIKRPQIGKLQVVVLSIILVILFARFFYTLPW